MKNDLWERFEIGSRASFWYSCSLGAEWIMPGRPRETLRGERGARGKTCFHRVLLRTPGTSLINLGTYGKCDIDQITGYTYLDFIKKIIFCT